MVVLIENLLINVWPVNNDKLIKTDLILQLPVAYFESRISKKVSVRFFIDYFCWISAESTFYIVNKKNPDKILIKQFYWTAAVSHLKMSVYIQLNNC